MVGAALCRFAGLKDALQIGAGDRGAVVPNAKAYGGLIGRDRNIDARPVSGSGAILTGCGRGIERVVDQVAKSRTATSSGTVAGSAGAELTEATHSPAVPGQFLAEHPKEQRYRVGLGPRGRSPLSGGSREDVMQVPTARSPAPI